jgi:hypothetical protein
MKKTDLYKNQGLKIASQMKQAGTPARFAELSATIPDRREQRKLDQAQGLVPFAVKLNIELVNQINTLAKSREMNINDLTATLLQAGLANQ